MVALLIVLSFGLTGVTLNHPSWTFGDGVDTTTSSGSLPFATTLDGGGVDFLSISEFARQQGVVGDVSTFDAAGDAGSITYRHPGYVATITFAVSSGAYELRIDQQGWMAVLTTSTRAATPAVRGAGSSTSPAASSW